FPVALAEEAQCGLDPLLRLVGRVAQFLGRERGGRDDEQALDDARECIERIGGDQAERAFQETLLSTSARAILIGANGAAWLMTISSCLRSSRRARKATATSTRDMPATSRSKSNSRRRWRRARNRSTKRATGGKRRAMCASDTCGGSAASARSAP